MLHQTFAKRIIITRTMHRVHCRSKQIERNVKHIVIPTFKYYNPVSISTQSLDFVSQSSLMECSGSEL